MPAPAVEPGSLEKKFHTSGLIRLTRPQMFATMTGLLLSVLLAARSNHRGHRRAAHHRAALRI
jgi:hypothetical protein